MTSLGFENPKLALARVDSAEHKGAFTTANANVVKAIIYWNTDRCQMAAFCCEQALTDAELKADSSAYCSAHGILADYNTTIGEFGKAIEHIDNALSFLSDNASRKRLSMRSRMLTLKAECERELRHADAAERLYLESIDMLMAGTAHPQDWSEVDPMIYTILEATEHLLDNRKAAEALPLLAKGDTALARMERTPGVPDYLLTLRRNNLTICQAMIYAANGQHQQAEALYNKHRSADGLTDADFAAEAQYLMMTDRPQMAAMLFQKADSMVIANGEPISFDYITLRMMPQYDALQKAGLTAQAFALSHRINQLKDSIRVAERRTNVEQQQEIMHQKEEINQRQQSIIVHRIIIVASVLLLLMAIYIIRRIYRYNRLLTKKNRILYEQIQQREHEQQQAIEQLEAAPETSLTPNQQIYRRLCEMVKNPDVFTDPDTNQDTLASLAGTNRTYVYDALRECADQTPTDFINGYRLRHAAHLLATTNNSIVLVAELCGLTRSTFYRLFSDAYGMSPTDYRKVASK